MQLSRTRLHRLLPAVLLAAGAAAATSSPAQAQVREDTTAAPVVAADSVLPGAWMPEPAGVFLGYHRITPPPLRLVDRRLSEDRLQLHWTDLSGRWWHALESQLAGTRDTLWLGTHGLVPIPGMSRPALAARAAADSVTYLPYNDVETDSAAAEGALLPGRVGQYADLGMLVTGRGEMGGAWQRFEPCDALFNTCQQGFRPRMRPDLQFGVLLGGTITDRVHVSVDYDQTREFDAANNINVYYQGLEDEILQRFEMGDVSITMPQSRFLTGSIPGGNFGFRALAQVGPLEVQSVWAQQQGDIGSLDFNIDARTGRLYEDNEKVLDDHAYADGRFFFLVDPHSIPGYPHIDALALQNGDAPADVQPLGNSIQLYRDEQLSQSQRDASKVFLARTELPDLSDTTTAYVQRLSPNDYVVHPSNLWIMLRQPLGQNERLALSYVTASGDTIGTQGASAGSGGPEDAPLLRLLRGPAAEHFPEAPTWEYEMHQVYQVYAGELEPEDLQLEIKLGDASQGQNYADFEGSQVPLLRLFGLDENSPVDRVDRERIFLPSQLQTGVAAITGTYLFFPTLRPFADPPPTRALTAEQAEAALGAEANHRIYEERDPSLRSIARFRMVLSYRVRTDGLISEFSLNSFGVREGSERILVDGAPLQRGVDYTIDYTTGMVQLSNPQQLFAGRQSPNISAQFEQASLFDIAPKSIFGTTARWRLGQLGDVNLVGLYQSQRSVMARPQLGNEPNSIMMGGVTTSLRFDAGMLDRALDAIPGLRLAGESSIGVSGEFALSMPNPNTRGQAYLEDFEATAEVNVPMSALAWRLGSRPVSNIGGAGALPLTMDAANAIDLSWQHQAFAGNGGTFGALIADSIDQVIRTAGRGIPEPVLYITMYEDAELAENERMWRSMTTVLSKSGADLTSSEYLEFYALELKDDISLVLDIGTVSEDAFFFDSTNATSGTLENGAPWGLGTLDQEAAFDQPWGVDLDKGLWNQLCQVEPGMMFVLGSRAANCTGNNGVNDSEDLDGDGAPELDDGAYFRYVVPIGPNSPYLARDQHETGSRWRLYRIPLRAADAVALNGADENTWRTVKHLRMTLTASNCSDADGGCDADVFHLARMRISGSTWEKREIEGVMAGLIGGEVLPGDHSRNVNVGPVSQLNEPSYLHPPGAVEQASDPSQEIGATGVEINEKGLRIIARELEPDARVEAFYRFPSETRSFMQYQQLRLWALPRAGDWGEGGTVSLLVKIGTDDDNYYLYRTPLRPAIENRDITSMAYWLPEVTVDFEPWFELKARAETEAERSDSAATVYWNADSTHAIVLSSRAQAPNLAGIRELSVAVYNEDGLPADSIEVWINDIRLDQGRTDVGYAGTVSIDARAADFANVRFTLTKQNPMFHPLNRDATLQGTNDIGVDARFEMGHFAPSGWGLAMPVSVQHTRQGATPAFLNRTDIRADELEGLRESGASSTQVGLALSKSTPAANPWLGLLVDGARLSLNWRGAARDEFKRSNSTSQLGGAFDYEHQLQPRLLDITPGFFVDFLRLITPARVERSDLFARVSGAELRWSPSVVSFSTSYVDRKSETFNYPTVLRSAADDSIAPQRSPQRDLLNSASIGFRPFESLTGRLSMSSSRDLLGGADLRATPLGQRAVEDARMELAGLDLGWEKSRSMGGMMEFQPRLSTWLRPSITVSSDYQTQRTPHYLEVDTVRVDASTLDTLDATMQRDFDVTGRLERRLTFDPGGLARALWGQDAEGLGLMSGALNTLLAAVMPLDFAWTNSRTSVFERSPFEPGYRYKFGLGDLGDLRLVDGDTAVTATEQDRFQVRGGVRLPFGLQLDATYLSNDRNGVTAHGGDNVTTDRTWPDVRLGMATLPLPDFVDPLIARVSASAGYRVEWAEQRFSSGLRNRESASIPVQFSTTFVNGLTASYNGTFGESTGLETTGEQEGSDRTHGVQVRFTFDPPESLGPKFTQPMTASLGYTYSSSMLCFVGGLRGLAESDERCARTLDRLSRDVHVTLETMIDDLNVGAQFSLNQHKSFVQMREGSREFRLAIFANFNFGVGVLPEGLGAGRFGY